MTDQNSAHRVDGGIGDPDTLASDGVLLGDPKRRRLMAIGLALIVLLTFMWSFPIKEIKARWRDQASPAYQVVRLESFWDFFAPDVLLTSQQVWVEIDRTDGTTERWDFPGDDELPFTYRSYRWIKYESQIFFDQSLWPIALDYVQENADAPGTIVGLRLIGAESAPALGNSGPFDPAYVERTLAEREVTPR